MSLATRSRKKGWIKRKLARLRLFEDPLGEAATTAPEVIELIGEGPAVEIFVGTAPDLMRATRVLVWSLMKVRNPARKYRIHLMANLKGYARKGWPTGFHGYAAAVADFEGGGRAIYCDASMIFTADPAVLYDEADAGVISLVQPSAPDRWRQQGDSPVTDGAGPINPSAWSSAPISADGSGAKQTGTRNTQWRELEADANEAGYLLFTRDTPTREFGELIHLYQQMHDENYFPGTRLKPHIEPVRKLLDKTGATRLLDYGSGKAEGYQRLEGKADDSPWRESSQWPGILVRCYDPGVAEFSAIGDDQMDGVISTDVVEHLAPFDVTWVLDEMFARADKFVFVVAACYPAIKTLPDGRNAHTTIQSAAWWRDQMMIVGHRHPNIRWLVGCDMKNLTGKQTVFFGGIGSAVDG